MEAEEIVRYRHALHAHPELSGEEKSTHNLIVDFLQKCNPTQLYSHVGGFGVVAAFGEKGAPCVVLRADIDALPIQEETVIPYRSEQKGVAHKCGHDGHTAILLAVAERIARHPVKCTVLLLFQPAEETGEGAARVWSSGILQGYSPRAIYGLHNLPGFPKSCLVFKDNTFAAASVGWVIRLQGRQTHAAFPELGLNPALAVAEIISEVLARNLRPEVGEAQFHQATLIHARIGEVAFGTAAGDAVVMFTLRAFTNCEMRLWKEQLCQLLQQIAERHGLKSEWEWREPFMATENHPAAMERLRQVAQENGFSFQEIQQPFRWSEDFSLYLTNCEGAFFGIGSGEETPELHHPDFDFPDGIIPTAADFFEKLLRSY